MYKIGINQNEKTIYHQKINVKKQRKWLLKISTLLFVIIVVITTMMVLIFDSNKLNSTISNNDASNWSADQDKNWEEYYQHNCPSNKKYNLTNYQQYLKNITLKATTKTIKFFYLNDLLKNIDNLLEVNNVDIPNNFFTHLPINPAISIKINGEDALSNHFLIKIPLSQQRKEFPIMISVNQLGNNYNLVSCDLNFNFNVENDIVVEKSLLVIKSTLENDKALITQQMHVIDDTNVSKTDINNHLNTVVGNEIKKVAKQQWQQDFDERDYIITTNAASGNYQLAKPILVTIVGKRQLHDTISLQILMQCQNQDPNQNLFKNNNFDVNDLNTIALYPNVLLNEDVKYTITFKNDGNSLISLLFKAAVADLNNFCTVTNLNLEMNVGINLDGDNYQIHLLAENINPNIIKKVNAVMLVSSANQIGDYQHLTEIGIIIKYDDNQQFKIVKDLDINIKNNILTFINFSSLVTITSWR